MAGCNTIHVKGGKRRKPKKSPFVKLDHRLLNSNAYRCLSLTARELLRHVLQKYRGYNNGLIPITHEEVKDFIASKSTLIKTIKELVFVELIVKTREGGLCYGNSQRSSLYGLTWIGIDEPPTGVYIDATPSKTPLKPLQSFESTREIPPKYWIDKTSLGPEFQEKSWSWVKPPSRASKTESERLKKAGPLIKSNRSKLPSFSEKV